MTRNFQYRIYPTGKQARQMESILRICQRLWNYFLAQRTTAYKKDKKSISCFSQMKEIPQLAVKDPVVKEANAQSLQEVVRRLDKSFQGFFRRVKAGEKPGYPRFRTIDRYNSFTYPQSKGNFNLTEDGKIRLSKIGCVKIEYHREVKGNWKTCTVKRTSTGKWYVVISAEQDETTVKKSTNPPVGVDLGLKEFAVFSDGSKIKRARFFKAEEAALAKAQRKLAKQIRGTSSRQKAKKVIARICERTVNKRTDFTHQWSRRIVNRYGTICLEKLDTKGMLEKPTITINGVEHSATPTHRSIQDVAWNQFVNQLKYKAEDAGASVVFVNPKNTTKQCSNPTCGKLVEKDLSERIHKCPHCGLVIDRDLNATRNILRLGLQSLEAQKAA